MIHSGFCSSMPQAIDRRRAVPVAPTDAEDTLFPFHVSTLYSSDFCTLDRVNPTLDHNYKSCSGVNPLFALLRIRRSYRRRAVPVAPVDAEDTLFPFHVSTLSYPDFCALDYNQKSCAPLLFAFP